MDAIVTLKQHIYNHFQKDVKITHLTLHLCHQGSARYVMDGKEWTFHANDILVLLPGQSIVQKECTEDFTISYVYLSQDFFERVTQFYTLKRFDHYYKHPICPISEERADKLMKIIEILSDIAEYNDNDLQMRQQLLTAQLFVFFEFVHWMYSRMEKEEQINPRATLYKNFCQAVIEHFSESHEAKYYAELFNYSPKHFTRIIYKEAGITPADWIEQFIITRAKMLIEANPSLALVKIAYMLGFNEPTSFYRYFKRGTGMTAKQYRKQVKGIDN